MIRLRFVQEYRGRRIVTNGKLYGIEGELVTDCRYLNVEGARAAINSEAGIAARGADIDRHRKELAEHIAREGREKTFGCSCGWAGGYGELTKTGMPVLFRCPTCSSDFLFMAVGDSRQEPTPPRERAVGKRMTAEKKSEEALAAETTRPLASQMPPLDGAELRFSWALEREGDDHYYVVKSGRTRVWRERASSGDPLRFYEVKRALKKKYRARFVSLTATAAAAKHMLRNGARSRRTSA